MLAAHPREHHINTESAALNKEFLVVKILHTTRNKEYKKMDIHFLKQIKL